MPGPEQGWRPITCLDALTLSLREVTFSRATIRCLLKDWSRGWLPGQPGSRRAGVVILPGGTVTLFFSDVEGSTRLVQQLGVEYGGVLGELRWILRVAVADKDGREIDCRADELFAVFGVRGTIAAATTAQLAADDP